jgi:hypothetical protein
MEKSMKKFEKLTVFLNFWRFVKIFKFKREKINDRNIEI